LTSSPTSIVVGSRLGSDLTVLGIVDDRGDEPVYLVWHHRSWCPMACKVLEPDAAQREADILRPLAHPNIVRCFGVSGSNCLLMEYLEGPSLCGHLRSRPKHRLGINDALRLAIHIGAALCHVHESGLVHLDVKPANIIVVGGRPILCDFGIARWQSEPRPSGFRGTDHYAAPEEALGESATPAADVFGLGVTLYELLTGRMPFRKRKKEGPFPQVDEPPEPLRMHRPAVARALENLILSCLNRLPAARPNLATLLPALHAFIGSGPPMWPETFWPGQQQRQA
jgi:serine/threonine protein kinase